MMYNSLFFQLDPVDWLAYKFANPLWCLITAARFGIVDLKNSQ